MTAATTASAPGKVVLSGEYAVLDGAPAISMAVEQRARATVRDRSGQKSRVTVRGYGSETARFESADPGIQWLDGNRQYEIVDRVWHAAAVPKERVTDVLLDTAAFFDRATGRKTGLGSSAALTVALAAAVKGSTDIAAIAHRAHRDLQGGAGSGVDIATAVSGGLIEYRMAGCAVRRIAWPTGLEFRLVWTGVVSSTRDKLAQLDAGVTGASRIRLVAAAEKMAEAWWSGKAAAIVAQCRDYNEHLRRFSAEHGLGVFDAGHDELVQAADAAGLAYKPCGAGGGDIGIVLGQDTSVLDAFIGGLDDRFSILDCAISNAGVRIDV